jgi:hypothetical protein
MDFPGTEKRRFKSLLLNEAIPEILRPHKMVLCSYHSYQEIESLKFKKNGPPFYYSGSNEPSIANAFNPTNRKS